MSKIDIHKMVEDLRIACKGEGLDFLCYVGEDDALLVASADSKDRFVKRFAKSVAKHNSMRLLFNKVYSTLKHAYLWA